MRARINEVSEVSWRKFALRFTETVIQNILQNSAKSIGFQEEAAIWILAPRIFDLIESNEASVWVR